MKCIFCHSESAHLFGGVQCCIKAYQRMAEICDEYAEMYDRLNNQDEVKYTVHEEALKNFIEEGCKVDNLTVQPDGCWSATIVPTRSFLYVTE